MVSGDCGGTGNPISTLRLPKPMAVPWLSCRKLAVTVDVSAILIWLGLATLVSTMNGSKHTWRAAAGHVAPLESIVLLGVFVPHQLFCAVTTVPGSEGFGSCRLCRLLPRPPVVFPANRLNCMLTAPPASSTSMPPPFTAAELPVIVTLERLRVSGPTLA